MSTLSHNPTLLDPSVPGVSDVSFQSLNDNVLPELSPVAELGCGV